MMLRHCRFFNTFEIIQKRYYQCENGVYGYRHIRQPKSQDASKIIRPDYNKQCNLYMWVDAYRKYGHMLAKTNPVTMETVPFLKQLDPTAYGLKLNDSTPNTVLSTTVTHNKSQTVEELSRLLNRIYCGELSAEIQHIQSAEEVEWLNRNYEDIFSKTMTKNEKKDILELLIKSQCWDNFLATKFPTVKRYGGEGAESMLAFFSRMFISCIEGKIDNVIVAMPHRGRGNLLTTMLNDRPVKYFRKFKGKSEFPDNINLMEDVVSHFHASEDIIVHGKKLHVSLLRNPSQLEAVNPVSMGKTRSKQQDFQNGSYACSAATSNNFVSNVLNVQLHGDAAFSGQGVNQECLMMSYVPHFDIGGTIHLVVNNQIGFTTPANRARSTKYCTDLAKSIDAPIFHVNGENPEMVYLVSELAFKYQQKFHKDVFIDLNVYRRWGHNELDDPMFTNPLLYNIINKRSSIPDKFADNLISDGLLENKELESLKQNYINYLSQELDITDSYEPLNNSFDKQWSDMKLATNSVTYWDTGLDTSLLLYIGIHSVDFPNSFNIHPHLQKTHIQSRIKRLTETNKIDWSTAEALAIGSLMYQGHNVRISGEDVGRGTFSQRHAMLVDQQSNEIFIPLNDIKGGNGGKLEIANSILSEEAVLGFEYGMAIDNPTKLIIWEAQFGDFSNGAQIIIDNFIASGETKWMQSNGLVMLLPHGYDGAASEHSSCRIERFLQLSDSKENVPDGDDTNLHIVNPTTPAQYYHVLRRQLIRDFRKPLVVVSPKTLLRLSSATSKLEEFESGTYFQSVLPDSNEYYAQITRIILCSGKHFYNLDVERRTKGIKNCAIIRLESLSPFPMQELQKYLEKYKNAKKFIWCQEEPRNMGAWSFVRPRFENLLGKALQYCGREEAATAATGKGYIHRSELEMITTKPFSM